MNVPVSLLASLLLFGLVACSESGDATPAGSPLPAGGPPPGAALYGVNVNVSYPGAQALDSTAMVYVFLRKPGTRMPLAVQHFAATELPKAVSFAGTGQDDAVELVVRLSPSGRVDRSAEDVEFSQMLPGLLHPPQTVQVVLGSTGSPAGRTAEAALVAAVTPVTIHATVAIGAGGTLDPEAVVFVVARRPGQAMPAAVKRLSVADLPAQIELSDADAMTFGNRLSDAPSLEVSARVSLSGTASRSDADWISDTVRVDTARTPEKIALTLHPPAGA